MDITWWYTKQNNVHVAVDAYDSWARRALFAAVQQEDRTIAASEWSAVSFLIFKISKGKLFHNRTFEFGVQSNLPWYVGNASIREDLKQHGRQRTSRPLTANDSIVDLTLARTTL